MIKQFFYLSTLFIIFSTTICAQQDQDFSKQKKERKDINDQVIVDDLIVVGSIAVGTDAVDGETFGFDTFRLKENNLQIHFDDTSVAGFASNDWRIKINESGNGGSNYFGIEDATAGRMPFKILAGASDNAFFMAANGDIGLGTDSPLVNLHIVDGDSPTLRIEQDASGGWTPQSWDVSGNESNFFIRDNTNGSTLPFRIKPGAPQNALFIAANGNIGLGTATPNANASLELKSANKGFLLNRLTTAEKTTLQSLLVAEDIGLMVYDTDIKGLFSWDGTQWISVVNTDAQDLALTTNTLSLTNDGTAVDLSGYLDNTDAQDLSLSTNTLSLTNDGTTVDLSGYLDNTDAQDLSLSTNTLSLTNDGTTVDLSGYLDNIDAQTVSLTGTTLAISNGNTLDLSSLQDGIGTDAQDLALTTNTLSLTNDGTPVDLSGYLDNTDAQTVSLTGTTLAISNGNTLNLSSLQDGIGTDAQDLSLSTNTLSLTNDGTPVDLSGYLDNTDAQTVSLTGTTLAISNGNNVDLSSLQDGIGTDAQDLTSAVLSGNVLEIEIENGNSVSVDLSPVLSSLQAEINTQSEMITDLVARIEAVEACACGGTLAAEGIQNKNSNFKLSQNKPNPFNGETKIDFKIPSDIQKAYIKIYDSNGKTLQKIAITQRGEGSITYDNDRFSSGLYYYSLFADNIKVDTKKMLLHNK
ncbi:MAG: hypothetical protein ACJAT9_000224 [Polaribacter sp.]|jgi:hypothetical protein